MIKVSTFIFKSIFRLLWVFFLRTLLLQVSIVCKLFFFCNFNIHIFYFIISSGTVIATFVVSNCDVDSLVVTNSPVFEVDLEVISFLRMDGLNLTLNQFVDYDIDVSDGIILTVLIFSINITLSNNSLYMVISWHAYSSTHFNEKLLPRYK